MQSVGKAVLIALLGAFLAASIACSKHPNDDAMAKDIQNKIAADPATNDSQVQVVAKDGKVTLSGTAKNPAAQQRAEQIAHDEAGTTGVDDQTSVASSAMAQDQSAMPAAAPPPPEEKPKPQPIVVPAGTSLTVRLEQGLSSKDSQEGQTFLATVAQPVSVNGKTAIPAGSTASGTVIVAKKKGKIKGEGQLSIALTSITVRGKTHAIQTGTFDSTAKGKGKRTAATTGGGAAGGALIGGIAGGGKGAAIGALAGAGAGLVGGAMTGNKQVELPAESALTFKLSAPLTLPPVAE